MLERGFTLIELLAIIVILAIILLIAVPQVLDIIEDVKNNAYISTKDLVVEAAELYMASHVDKLPNEDETFVLELSSDLQAGGYIDEVSSMGNTCSGYVVVTKIDEDSYSYLPSINCSSTTVTNPTDDNLVFHYAFDDFEEPTMNLVPIEQRTCETLFSKRISYNSGVFEYTLETEIENREDVIRIYSNPTEATDSYTGFGFQAANDSYSNIGDVYAISFEYKVLKGVNDPYFSLAYADGYKNPTATCISVKSNKKIEEIGNGWYKYSEIATLTEAGNTFWRFNVFTDDVETEVLVDNFQVEYKDHVTPFVDGERTGTVKDYSGNGNNAALDLTTTPTWVFDSERGSGVYEFTNDLINVGGRTEDVLTLAAWVKKTNNNNIWNGIMGPAGGGFVHLQIQYTQLNFYLYGPNVGEGASGYVSTNDWHYIVITYDGEYARTYIDGVKTEEKEATGNPVEEIDYYIGRTYSDERFFGGFIDDVRIYSRALSDEEVKELYLTTK